MALPLKVLNQLYWQNGFYPLFRPLVGGYSPSQYSTYKRPGTPPDKTPPWADINFSFQKGVEVIKKHFGLLVKEVHDHLRGPDGLTLEEYMLEQTRVAWQFRSEEDLNGWIISSDAEIGGKSEVYLKLGKNNQSAVLYGTLNSQVPRDGETRYSGYCSMKSKTRLGAFNRKRPYDWSSFNCLHIRARGDGRPWMINIYTDPHYSNCKDELYHYFMFTRGGPYWEEIKIPFSKFFWSIRGRIQDQQSGLWVDRISTLGFTLGDQVDGPFQLEIDYIGLAKDRTHKEVCSYEQNEMNPKKKMITGGL